MWMRFASISLLLLGTTLVWGAENSTYNKGVQAWKRKDYVQAKSLWEQSLVNGERDGVYNNLGYLFYYGLGVTADKEKGVEFWRKGAALAISEAQWHLGNAFEDGEAVTQDFVKAYAWYICAISTSSKLSSSDATEAKIQKLADESRVKLLAKLDSAERSKGEKLAAELVAKYATRLSP